jgi:hypothetical protein
VDASAPFLGPDGEFPEEGKAGLFAAASGQFGSSEEAVFRGKLDTGEIHDQGMHNQGMDGQEMWAGMEMGTGINTEELMRASMAGILLVMK